MYTTLATQRHPAHLMRCIFVLPLLLVLGIGDLHAADGEANHFYEEGLQSYNDGDFRSSVIHLKNALQLDPTILSAHILLGRAYVEEGSGGSAERELKSSLGLGADRSLVLPALARAYMLQRKYKQVVEEVYPDTGDAETDAEILLRRGNAHVELGELDLATDAFAKAAVMRPQDTGPLLGKAGVLLKQNENAAAEAEVVAAIELDADDPNVWLMKGMIVHARGDVQAALADYEKALSLDPGNEAAQFARLGALVDMGEDEEAAGAAKAYRADFPEDARAAYLLAVILSRSGDRAGARQALEEAYALLSRLPEEVLEAHAPSFLLAGVVAYSLGKFEEAHTRLERYIGTNPPAPGARKLLGSVLMKKGDYASAIKVLEPALVVEPTNHRLLLMLGESLMRERRHHPAGELFERALRLRPDSAQARVERAVNRLAAGQEAAAVDELSAVFDEQPEITRVGTLLVDLYFKQGNALAATEAAARLVELEPDVLSHRNRLALALLRSDRTEEARQTLDQVLVRDPENTAAALNLAKLDLLLGRVPDAAARYQALLVRLPGEPRATIGLARALGAQGRSGEAIDLLGQVQRGEGDIAESFRLNATGPLVELLISTGQTDRALQAAEQAQLLAPADSRVLRAMGSVHLAMGDKVVAQGLYRRLSKDAGYDAAQLFEIARLQFLADDLEGAEWSISKAVDANPGLLEARVKQVELLGALGNFEKALERAEALASEQPDESEAHRVLGDVLLGTGDNEGALGSYQRALSIAPSESAVLRVYRVRRALGQDEAARALLRSRLKANPGERAVRTALAENYLSAGDQEAARAEYEALTEGGAGTAAHLNNLAVIYTREGDPRAMEFARRAHELKPDLAATNDTLGWLLVQAGDVERGLGYLRKAEARAAQDPEIRYHIGVAMHRLGRLGEARALLERALGVGRPFDGEADARVLLEELRP